MRLEKQKVRPTFVKEPLDERARVTNDVELACEVRGVPTPAVQWYKNGELLVESEYFQVGRRLSAFLPFQVIELERYSDCPWDQPEDFGRRGKGYRGVPVRGLQSGRKRAGIRAAVSGA